jgi:class 3 adenylate cyclase/tetratricopeptide (TPR) repeat protein
LDIEQWLAELGLERYAEEFAREEITVEDLRHLTDDDLAAVGLPLGPRRRILRAVRSEATHDPEPSKPGIGDTERRTMTVVFCDLVGSTALSSRLDPEDLHAVMTVYQESVTDAFTTRGGHVAKYLGDGTLVYFGWPEAHEDQAVHAVRAALAAVESVADLEVDIVAGVTLASRVGIATGPVVIGDIAGEADAVVGETANLAARLEGLAPTGAVVVDATTASLVREAIDLGASEEHEAKGFADPVSAFQVLGRRDAPSRFEAAATTRGSGPFVGRDAELGLLRQAWDRTTDGSGGVVLVGGEAGIGKSRLVHEFLATIDVPLGRRLLLQCIDERRATPFHPFLDELRRSAGGDDAAAFAPVVSALGGDPEVDADLLSGAASGTAPPDGATPEQRNARLRELLAHRVAGTHETGPAVLVVEDLHWADASSVGLVRDLLLHARSAPLLVLGTHRPDWEPKHLRAANATSISLGGLDRAAVETLARSIDPALDDAAIDEFASTTGGNPLYAEEFARATGEGSGVPISLEASLLARLDRLGEEKTLARVAAVAGRTTPALASAMLEADPTVIRDGLERLVDADLLAADPLEAGVYEFNHALLREIAYRNLSRRDRRELHRRAAEHLLHAGSPPHDVIAGHLAAAGFHDRAIDEWRRAGSIASGFGSTEEAVAAYRAALEVVGHLPEGDARSRLELDVLLDLAPAQMTLRGYASGEASALHARAAELAEELGDTDAGFMAAWGAYYGTEVRADFKRSEDDVRRLLDIDRSTLRPDLPIEIDHAALTYYSATGWPTRGLPHAERIIEEYDFDLHAEHRDQFVHDALVCAYNQQALAFLQTGDIGAGWVARDRSRAVAERLGHAPTLAQTLWFASWWFEGLGRAEENRRAIAAGLEHCRAHNVRALVRSFELFGAAALEDRAAAYRALREPIDSLRKHGRGGFTVPLLAVLLAELAVDAGAIDHAMVTLDFGDVVAERSGEMGNRGRALAARGRALVADGDPTEAQRVFRAGLAFCDERSIHADALRNAAGLARLLASFGNVEEARALLARRLAAVTGGDDSPLVAEPRELLTSLT